MLKILLLVPIIFVFLAAGGLVRGISKSSKPSHVYKNFVSRCLREKGYEPVGWQ